MKTPDVDVILKSSPDESKNKHQKELEKKVVLLEENLAFFKKRSQTWEKEVTKQEEKILSWKREVNRKDIELSRLRVKVQMQESKLADFEQRITKQNKEIFMKQINDVESGDDKNSCAENIPETEAKNLEKITHNGSRQESMV